MKYVPKESSEGRSPEGYVRYLDQIDHERLLHVAKKVGLTIDSASSSDAEIVGQILDEITEFMCSEFSTGQWPMRKRKHQYYW